MGKRRYVIAALLAGTVGMIVPSQVWAQDGQAYPFDMPSQDLGDALRSIAARAGWELYAQTDDLNGKVAPAMRGSLTAREAIERLLKGTNLEARFDRGAVIIRGRATARAALSTPPDGDDIVVTGTRIRRSEPVNSVVTASRSEIEKSGQSNLGEFIRSLPQNFGGGQNPGIVGGGVQGGSENVGATSALNLRGLGPDATLTLINGHRVAYDGAAQGVDISAIPLAALERIEIVPDGASALYGSDAVGGVANVILRKDFEGAVTSARIWGATDGGAFTEQYDLVTGSKWESGGFMLAGGFNRSTAVTAAQRSYTQALDGSSTLIPYQKQYSAVFNGHQTLSPNFEFGLDAQYSRRESSFANPTTATSDARTNGNIYFPRVTSYSISPVINASVGADWKVSLIGIYGRSLTNVPGNAYAAGTLASTSNVFYDNRLYTVELRGDGTIFSLPGGNIGLAVGGGYRGFSLRSKSAIAFGATTINLLNIHHRENVEYAFGEISVPIFGPGNRQPFFDMLQLSAAVRYERYEGLADVASPKLGVVYRPTPSVTIKGSWGKSFKAPTFYQRYKVYQALLIGAADLGQDGVIGDKVLLYLAGGNPDLKPERASTWTVSAAFAPTSVPGLRFEANYYNIKYRNRVVNPLTSTVGLFSSSTYSSLITYSPSAALLDQLIAPAAGAFGLQNFTGQPYDPATVYAVVDARAQNTAYQAIQGIDLSARYAFDLAAGGTLDLNAAGSYIDSNRRLLAGQPTTPTAGVIFYPPHWRARGGATFEQGNVTISGFLNYVGGVTDNRQQPQLRISSFVSTDLVAKVSGTDGIFRGADLTLAVSNLFNRKPETIRTSSLIDPPYDSTNYPALGRVISATITKRW